MMTNREVQFCPGCFHSSTYTVKRETETINLKGEQYDVSQTLAFCDRCGHELLVDELTTENAQVLYDAYRVRHGIISLEDIRRIPQKYNIGKRPLSRILGWGENTLSRYIDGDIPSKQYSDVLKQILNDAEYYLTLLERNIDALESKTAYEKSLAATNQLIKASST